MIGSFMGIAPEEDQMWAEMMNATLAANDADMNPDGVESVAAEVLPKIFASCGRMIAERRENPTDDLTSVLVHAELDGDMLEEHEIVMGFFLLMAAGNDSTKATFCSGMRALMEDDEQRQLLLDDPALIPDAVEEALRMYPAFAHFGRTATVDTELNGQPIEAGDKVVMWYPSSCRDEERYEDADTFDLRRKAEHQAFGAGGRHFCLGAALARLELRILIEETLARYPEIRLAGEPRHVESPFANQLKTLPVELAPYRAPSLYDQTPQTGGRGRLAQLGEHFPYKEGVTGSSPVPPMMQIAALDWSGDMQGGGRTKTGRPSRLTDA